MARWRGALHSLPVRDLHRFPPWRRRSYLKVLRSSIIQQKSCSSPKNSAAASTVHRCRLACSSCGRRRHTVQYVPQKLLPPPSLPQLETKLGGEYVQEDDTIGGDPDDRHEVGVEEGHESPFL